MGLFSNFATASRLLLSEPTAPVANPGDTVPSAITSTLSSSRASRVARDIAMSISAVRKAMHLISGLPSTWHFVATDYATGGEVPPTDRRVAWLAKPDSVEELPWTIARTMSDLVWHDRSVWRITDELVTGHPVKADRVHPSRVDVLTNPLDPDRVDKWLIDGREVPRSRLIIAAGGGIGGLERYGYDLLTLYGQLQAAAGRYAVAPHPHAILKNHGQDLTDDEIDELLDAWEQARSTRSVGYLNDVIDYETHGWNAEELQLTDAREHAALEVARLFGLPAAALDAKSGQSLTYANRVDNRLELVAALGPWLKPLEAAVSAAAGVAVELDSSSYTAASPQERMGMWGTALDKGILTLDQVHAQEPLARSHR